MDAIKDMILDIPPFFTFPPFSTIICGIVEILTSGELEEIPGLGTVIKFLKTYILAIFIIAIVLIKVLQFFSPEIWHWFEKKKRFPKEYQKTKTPDYPVATDGSWISSKANQVKAAVMDMGNKMGDAIKNMEGSIDHKVTVTAWNMFINACQIILSLFAWDMEQLSHDMGHFWTEDTINTRLFRDGCNRFIVGEYANDFSLYECHNDRRSLDEHPTHSYYRDPANVCGMQYDGWLAANDIQGDTFNTRSNNNTMGLDVYREQLLDPVEKSMASDTLIPDRNEQTGSLPLDNEFVDRMFRLEGKGPDNASNTAGTFYTADIPGGQNIKDHSLAYIHYKLCHNGKYCPEMADIYGKMGLGKGLDNFKCVSNGSLTQQEITTRLNDYNELYSSFHNRNSIKSYITCDSGYDDIISWGTDSIKVKNFLTNSVVSTEEKYNLSHLDTSTRSWSPKDNQIIANGWCNTVPGCSLEKDMSTNGIINAIDISSAPRKYSVCCRASTAINTESGRFHETLLGWKIKEYFATHATTDWALLMLMNDQDREWTQFFDPVTVVGDLSSDYNGPGKTLVTDDNNDVTKTLRWWRETWNNMYPGLTNASNTDPSLLWQLILNGAEPRNLGGQPWFDHYNSYTRIAEIDSLPGNSWYKQASNMYGDCVPNLNTGTTKEDESQEQQTRIDDLRDSLDTLIADLNSMLKPDFTGALPGAAYGFTNQREEAMAVLYELSAGRNGETRSQRGFRGILADFDFAYTEITSLQCSPPGQALQNVENTMSAGAASLPPGFSIQAAVDNSGADSIAALAQEQLDDQTTDSDLVKAHQCNILNGSGVLGQLFIYSISEIINAIRNVDHPTIYRLNNDVLRSVFTQFDQYDRIQYIITFIDAVNNYVKGVAQVTMNDINNANTDIRGSSLKGFSAQNSDGRDYVDFFRGRDQIQQQIWLEELYSSRDNGTFDVDQEDVFLNELTSNNANNANSDNINLAKDKVEKLKTKLNLYTGDKNIFPKHKTLHSIGPPSSEYVNELISIVNHGNLVSAKLINKNIYGNNASGALNTIMSQKLNFQSIIWASFTPEKQLSANWEHRPTNHITGYMPAGSDGAWRAKSIERVLWKGIDHCDGTYYDMSASDTDTKMYPIVEGGEGISIQNASLAPYYPKDTDENKYYLYGFINDTWLPTSVEDCGGSLPSTHVYKAEFDQIKGDGDCDGGEDVDLWDHCRLKKLFPNIYLRAKAWAHDEIHMNGQAPYSLGPSHDDPNTCSGDSVMQAERSILYKKLQLLKSELSETDQLSNINNERPKIKRTQWENPDMSGENSYDNHNQNNIDAIEQMIDRMSDGENCTSDVMSEQTLEHCFGNFKPMIPSMWIPFYSDLITNAVGLFITCLIYGALFLLSLYIICLFNEPFRIAMKLDGSPTILKNLFTKKS